jgi:hypothetical protein
VRFAAADWPRSDAPATVHPASASAAKRKHRLVPHSAPHLAPEPGADWRSGFVAVLQKKGRLLGSVAAVATPARAASE